MQSSTSLELEVFPKREAVPSTTTNAPRDLIATGESSSLRHVPSTSSLSRISTAACDQPTYSALVSSSSTHGGMAALEIVAKRNGEGRSHENSIPTSGTDPSVQRKRSQQRESTGTSITSSTPQPEQTGTMPELPRPPQAIGQGSFGNRVIRAATTSSSTSGSSSSSIPITRPSRPSLSHPSEPPVAPAPASAQNAGTR